MKVNPHARSASDVKARMTFVAISKLGGREGCGDQCGNVGR